ncbi:OmpA family protein [Maribacter ulvicola]|uniref:Outer membrane protein OmpA n=1 Tax=Maribacter ulvicola TaxID=228959 RepID=A0A1N7AP60_9FLAO|nr:OmpA family protein [Maribacter ulvicola]SIR40778.1 Outer membrane protein OmpA [Maribacter ulvicola]
MKSQKIKSTLILLTVCCFAFSQSNKEKRAEEKFENYSFFEAIASYEDLVKDGFSDEKIYKKLGNAYYLNARYDKATNWYKQLFELESSSIDPEYLYRYAQSLKSLKKYDESFEWMKKFELAKVKDGRVQKFRKTYDYLKDIELNSNRYKIENIAINSKESDFSPSLYNENLIFATARDTRFTSSNVHEWNNKPFLNLYTSQITEDGSFLNTKKLSKNINKKTHESSTAFSKDGTTMYFTRNNSENGRFSRDKEGISRLKIYKATKINGEWGAITELPFNGDDYSTAHPSLNTDESKLYFASDMEGTLGASDIFVVDINSDGDFGIPVNMGSSINTEARETFPFITESGILYFASDGHPGLGGLDMFAAKIDNKEKAVIHNLGKPLNSEQDDFSFVIDEGKQKGFFASNRDGGIGSDDIYSFVEYKKLDFNCYSQINGKVKDLKTNEIIARVDLQLVGDNGDVLSKTVTNSDGGFQFEVPCENDNYKIIASKIDYEENKVSIHIEDTLEIFLKSTLIEEISGTDLAKSLQLNPIYFDLDKHSIRADAKVILEKVIAYMKQYPLSKIEIRSHTDSRAGDKYNQRLSTKRAKATVGYLVSQGVSKSRLVGIGYGESKLINLCTNNSSCSDTEHELNRRSEFIIIR